MKRWPLIGLVGAITIPLGLWLAAPRKVAESNSAAAPDDSSAPRRRRAPSAPGDAARLREQLSALSRGATDEDLANVILARLMSLAETDPATAVRLAAMLSDAQGREEALHECLPHWLRTEPDAARAWALGEAQVLPFSVIGSLARDVAELDPRLGLTLADKLPTGERASSLKDVFSAWAARDPAEAARVGEELLSVRDRVAALDAVGALWAEEDGQAAFEWANRYRTPAPRRAALESVVGAWARREPEAAALSLAAVPPGDVFRQRLLDDVAEGWAEADADQALKWADSLRPDTEREATLTTVLLELAGTDPERAADQAFRLTAGKVTDLVDKVIVFWAARDKAGATAWIRAHGLTLSLE